MTRLMMRLTTIVLIAVGAGVTSSLANQTAGGVRGRAPVEPLPQGQQLEARDGDIIVIEGDARVRIVRRRRAVARAVFNASNRSLLLLLDYAVERSGPPDGRVDYTYSFNGLTGDWPFQDRWEGDIVFDEYLTMEPGPPPRRGAGITTPQGLVQFLRREDIPLFRDPGAIAVLSYEGSGSGSSRGLSFDDAERQQAGGAMQNAQVQPRMPASPAAPLRVGGNIAPPRKIADMQPVYPEAARQAKIRGVIALEIVVGTDGAVTDARVLRSIPQLDQAAIDAVRKWRYEPVLLNGAPVPIIMTVTVSFDVY